MAQYFELEPAYGRDYKTAQEARAAWEAGKDFLGDVQLGFKPVNIQDIPKPSTVLLRYSGNRKLVTVSVPAPKPAPKPVSKPGDGVWVSE